MKATLTYRNLRRQTTIRFELDSPLTIVGRGASEALTLPGIAEKARRKEAFQVHQGDTLYLGIPSDLGLARKHFSIRRAETESGEVVFFIRDLGSHCGFFLNGDRPPGSAEIALKDGDRIFYGFEFVFNQVPDSPDLQEHQNTPNVPGNQPAQ